MNSPRPRRPQTSLTPAIAVDTGPVVHRHALLHHLAHPLQAQHQEVAGFVAGAVIYRVVSRRQMEREVAALDARRAAETEMTHAQIARMKENAPGGTASAAEMKKG